MMNAFAIDSRPATLCSKSFSSGAKRGDDTSSKEKFQASATTEKEPVEIVTKSIFLPDVSSVERICRGDHVISFVFGLSEGRDFVWMRVMPAYERIDVHDIFRASA